MKNYSRSYYRLNWWLGPYKGGLSIKGENRGFAESWMESGQRSECRVSTAIPGWPTPLRGQWRAEGSPDKVCTLWNQSPENETLKETSCRQQWPEAKAGIRVRTCDPSWVGSAEGSRWEAQARARGTKRVKEWGALLMPCGEGTSLRLSELCLPASARFVVTNLTSQSHPLPVPNYFIMCVALCSLQMRQGQPFLKCSQLRAVWWALKAWQVLTTRGNLISWAVVPGLWGPSCPVGLRAMVLHVMWLAI